MRKVMYGIAALALAAMTACSSENVDLGNAGDEVDVCFSLESPNSMQTRSINYNSGELANQLQWAVYQRNTDDGKLVASGTVSDFNKSTTVTVKLMKNYHYDVLFWAQNANAPYTFDKDSRSVKVSYTDAENTSNVLTYANDETRDAFYATLSDLKVTGETDNVDVTLHRPFSKIAIMTSNDDFVAALKYGQVYGSTPDASTISMDVYSEFDLMNEEVKGDASKVTFAPKAFAQEPNLYEGQKINDIQYFCIGSVFALTKASGELADVDFQYGTLNTDKELTNACDNISFTNIPVKKNQRTVIFGDIFTKSVNYNVAIDASMNNINLSAEDVVTPLEQTLYTGGDYKLEDDLTIAHSISTGAYPTEIDLNDHTLTISSTSSSFFRENADVTFKNGTIKYTDRAAAGACIAVMRDAKVTLDNVEMEVSGSALHVEGDAAALVVKDSKIKSTGNFAVATNASTSQNWNVKIDLENSEFEALYGVYINVPGTFIANKCKISGEKQALLLRGGDITLTNTEVDFTATTLDTTYDNATWGTGAFVAYAAVTIGNRNDGSYQYYTKANISGCTFSGPRAMYIWPNTASSDIGVFLTLGEGNTFNGDVEVNTKNLTIEGGTLPTGYKDITPSPVSAIRRR